MAEVKSRIDEGENTTQKASALNPSKKAKAFEEKDRVTLYLRKDTNRKLNAQSSMKFKEKDRTAIVEAAVSLLLDIDDDTYARLKAKAKQTGNSMGSIVEAALEKFL